MALFARFLEDETGALLVEATVLMTLMLVFVLGSVDFLFAFYQWNAAAKAVQIGARVAAVSNPVAIGLNNLSLAVLNDVVAPGAAMPAFKITCDGATSRCSCDSMGLCPNFIGYDAAAMNTIVFGRGSNRCGDAASVYDAGMCDILPRITPENVIIVYMQTRLGFAGRPGGPSPTITVSLQNLPYQFFFLQGLSGLANVMLPTLTTSITAEDMSSDAPSF